MKYQFRLGGRLTPARHPAAGQCQGAFTVYFDANGGTVEETSRLVTCGVALGELPVPELDSHTFLGWYDGQEETAARITAETVWHDGQDKTVYAHWRLNDSTSWIPVF